MNYSNIHLMHSNISMNSAFRQQQLGECWCVIVGKFFVDNLYSRKIFSYVFYVRKYFYNEEKKVNYGSVQKFVIYCCALNGN